jgi:hypothetical protein
MFIYILIFFNKLLERDITGPPRRKIKILKEPQLEVNYQLQTKPISKED